MKKICLLFLSLLSIQLWAGKNPMSTAWKEGSSIKIFKTPLKHSAEKTTKRNQYRVAEQMLHYWNETSYDTAFKYNMMYAANNFLSEKITHHYSGTSFSPFERELYYKDAVGRDTAVISQFYNPDLMVWDNSQKFVKQFDAMGNITFDATYINDDLKGWELMHAIKWQYVYDGSLKKVSVTVSSYFDSEWTLSFRELYEYTTGNQPSALIYQYYYNDIWENDSREEYVYTNGVLTQLKFYSWVGAWFPEFLFKDITWYDYAQEKWSYYLKQDYVNGNWKNSERGYGFYNAAGLPTKYEVHVFVGILWVPEYRERFEYDQFNNLTLEVEEEYSIPNWILTYGNRFTYEYNAQNNIAVEYKEYYDSFKKIGWVKEYKLQSWYEIVTGSTIANENLNARIYPNPATTTLTIEWNNSNETNHAYQIFDVNGRIVQMAAIKNENSNRLEINVSNLKTGVYFINITSGNRKQQLKFVKK